MTPATGAGTLARMSGQYSDLIDHTPKLVRSIAVGAADDADWPTVATAPPAAHLLHPGGKLTLYTRVVDANGQDVARGSMTYNFELQKRGTTYATEGTPVTGAVPNSHYVEQDAAPGGYLVRVYTKASPPAGGVTLQVWAQAGA